jgi:hypothetical protein
MVEFIDSRKVGRPMEEVEDRQAWLIVLADRLGLEWVLEHRQMAFPPSVCPNARRIRAGDGFLVYGAAPLGKKLLGAGRFSSGSRPLSPSIRLKFRELACVVDLDFDRILSPEEGLPFKPLVPRLKFIGRPEVWGTYLRRAILPLPAGDAAVLTQAFAHAAV